MDSIELKGPRVVPFPRRDYTWIEYLARVARVSRGISPFDCLAHKDPSKNLRTVHACATKKHTSVFEFWPYAKPYISGRCGTENGPGGYPYGDETYETLAHYARGRHGGWDYIQFAADRALDCYSLLSQTEYPCFHITASRTVLSHLRTYRYWFSFNSESQRCVVYGKHKPYMYLIDPDDDPIAAREHNELCYRRYREMIERGCKPEVARHRLPSDAVVQFVMAAPKARWIHLLRQRYLHETGKTQRVTYEVAAQIAEHLQWKG